MLEVWNKVDALGPEERAGVHRAAGESAVAVSALTGEGMDALVDAIERNLARHSATRAFRVPAADGALVSWLYRNTEVLRRTDDAEGNVHMTVRIPPVNEADTLLRAGVYLEE